MEYNRKSFKIFNQSISSSILLILLVTTLLFSELNPMLIKFDLKKLNFNKLMTNKFK